MKALLRLYLIIGALTSGLYVWPSYVAYFSLNETAVMVGSTAAEQRPFAVVESAANVVTWPLSVPFTYYTTEGNKHGFIW